MPVNDALGTRMKTYYEQVPKYRLMRRTPVAIRIDGKAFHTFTRGFQKPFDEVLGNSMVRTMEYLCQNIQGCIFGYTQSDEITLILQDYRKLNTDAWFDYEVQKMCSIAASMATMAFNTFFKNEVDKFYYNHCSREDLLFEKHYQTYRDAQYKGAMFDARCFNIPKEEVTNLIYWRQVDAARNSIQMAARAVFSHAECDNKNTSQLQDMLMEKYNINWNNYPTRWKRGVCWTKSGGTDYEMPMLKGEDREYVDHLVYFMEET
jgi:tRNA(His) 5'-end guanylyltransferase